ncbi:hypothetical protein OBBRIDRAFT_889572 [Obba rivulosa]|uniref:Uncharacterized protein n=1 Tax=Obba rivulosa TaxID=1052685 RepID=A0A8E2AP27_9APHY|nr:hypothetical protein OBBRIDRAFT_889572 [Obba rivulosa]
MIPRSQASKRAGRRLASTTVRQGRKGHLYVEPSDPLPPTPEEAVKITVRRVKKAERDERMDVTLSLTPVKTYMGGFTRPRDLRASNWFPGGAYVTRNKRYESPPDAAFEKHTVFLLESRYPVKHEVGRVDSYEHIVGMCRESDFPAIMQMYNSKYCPSDTRESMDNARWPWLKPKKVKSEMRHEWKEEAQLELKRLKNGEWTPDEVVKVVSIENAELTGSNMTATGSGPKPKKTRTKPTELVSSGLLTAESVDSPASLDQRRLFHASVSAPSSDSISSRDRVKIPGSSWSKPPRESQDADDSVVPTYYIEWKRQRDAISERKEEEGGLMAELNAGVLSDGIAAETKVREEKIPVEVKERDGTVRHPSGFEPPTPETEFHPAAAKEPTEEPNSLLTTVKQLWDERPAVDPAAPEPDTQVEQEFVRLRLECEVNAAGTLTTATSPLDTEPSGDPAPANVSADQSTFSERSDIQTSSWDSPSHSSRKSPHPEEVVPPYYIERKRQRESISERKEEEGSLMAELSAGILSEGLAAQTKAREEKIPVEVEGKDGSVQHPSGFVPPTPETDFHPAVSKTPEMPPKTPWTDVPAKKGRGFHSSAMVRAAEVDLPKNVLHAPDESESSISSAPADSDTNFVDFAQEEYDDALEDEDADEGDEGDEGEVVQEVKPRLSPAQEIDDARKKLRGQYIPTLKDTPFWRPLLTMTFPTRPIGLTILRLSKGMPRGTPFYATISNDDRKCHSSFPARMRCLRLDRMAQLTIDMAKLLAGQRGGIVGLRLSPKDRGRGINGERLDDRIPYDMRVIKVGVGEWYSRADEVKEAYKLDAQEAEVDDSIEVFGLDERGNRTDGGSWPESKSRPFVGNIERWMAVKLGVNIQELPPHVKNKRRAELAREYHREMVQDLAQSHRSVILPPFNMGFRQSEPSLQSEQSKDE